MIDTCLDGIYPSLRIEFDKFIHYPTCP